MRRRVDVSLSGDGHGVARPTEPWASLVGNLLSDLSAEEPGWVVLKNHAALPVVGGDIDTCLSRDRWDAFTDRLTGWLAGRGRYLVVSCDHYVGVRLLFVTPIGQGPVTRCLEIDLLDGVWWKGHQLVPARAVAEHAAADARGFRRTTPGWEAALRLTCSGLSRSGSLRTDAVERYEILRHASGNPAGFRTAMTILHGPFGSVAATRFSTGRWTAATGRRLAWGRMRGDGGAVLRRIAFFARRKAIGHWRGVPRQVNRDPSAWLRHAGRGHRCVHVDDRTSPDGTREGARPRMPAAGRSGRTASGAFITISGPDGTGKTTLARELSGTSWPGGTRVLHWRPGVLPRLGSIVGMPAADGSDPHGSEPYGRAVSTIRLLYYWLDEVVGYWLRIRPQRRAGALVILERGYWDMVVDPRRYRLGVPARLGAMLGNWVPEPDLTVILDGPPDLLAERKRELPPAEIERQAARWTELAVGRSHWHVVDASRTPTSIASDVDRLLRDGGRCDAARH